MNPAARDRLFNFRHAFDDPVSLWIVVGVAAAFAIAIAAIGVLSAGGRVSPAMRGELWKRTMSWLVMVPVVAVPILMGAFWTILLFCGLSLLCYREFARATGLFRHTTISLVVVLGIVAVNFTALDHWYGMFLALFPLTVIVLAAVAILPDQPKGYIQRVGLGVFGFSLFGVCLGHLSYFANHPNYRPILLMILVTVQLNDIIAFCFGKTLGRRKLAPNTSPGKTLGGSLGALLVTTPLVMLLCHWAFRGGALDHPTHLLAVGLIVAVGGQLGDLMISSVKRDVGIKDMGALIPGHGGVLDRCNSLLLVAPALFHYIGYFGGGVGLREPTQIFTGWLSR